MARSLDAEPLPFRPRDWVTDSSDRIARVRSVYEGNPGEVLLDLVMFEHDGNQIGRISPACGGPRSFEPACSADGWERIKEPIFPIRLIWVPDGTGKKVLRFWAGKRLPPANWTPPRRRSALRLPAHDPLRAALEKIADGYNDARTLARIALGR